MTKIIELQHGIKFNVDTYKEVKKARFFIDRCKKYNHPLIGKKIRFRYNNHIWGTIDKVEFDVINNDLVVLAYLTLNSMIVTTQEPVLIDAFKPTDYDVIYRRDLFVQCCDIID